MADQWLWEMVKSETLLKPMNDCILCRWSPMSWRDKELGRITAKCRYDILETSPGH